MSTCRAFYMHAWCPHEYQSHGGCSVLAWDAGVLGENLKLPESITKHVGGFFFINGATLLICILFFYAILAYIRYKRLM